MDEEKIVGGFRKAVQDFFEKYFKKSMIRMKKRESCLSKKLESLQNLKLE